MKIESLIKFYSIQNCFISKETSRLCWYISEQKQIKFKDTEEDRKLWNDLLTACKEDKVLRKKNFINVQQPVWNNNTYVLVSNKTYKSLLICKNMKIYYCYYSLAAKTNNDISSEVEQHMNDLAKTNKNKGLGHQAAQIIDDMLKKEYNNDKSLYATLSGSHYKDIWTATKLCVPRQIGWINPLSIKKVINNCFKADVSSAFPAQLIKAIPTLKYSKKVIGRVEPTEEYPFAFYLNSHHLAIYNELDTREDNKNVYLKQCVNNYKEVEEEVTLLCKAAPISLKNIMNKLYEIKNSATTQEEIARAKLTMNACIGYFQYNKHPGLSFVSAVVIARSNHFILEQVNQLIKEKNIIQYIATDSIVWQGKDSNVSTEEKYLGSFTKEYNNCSFYGVKVGAYQIKKEDGTVKTLCSYIDDKDIKNKMAFGTLPEPKKSKSLLFSDELYLY